MSEIPALRMGGGDSLPLLQTFDTGLLTFTGTAYSTSAVDMTVSNYHTWFTPNVRGLQHVLLEISSNFSGTVTANTNDSGYIDASIGLVPDANNRFGRLALFRARAERGTTNYPSESHILKRESLPLIMNDGDPDMYFFLNYPNSYANINDLSNIGATIDPGWCTGTATISGNITIKMYGK